MITAHFDVVNHVVALGAHCDDIEIGAGCTIQNLIAKHPDIHVDWIVCSSDPTRRDEARQSAEYWLADAASRSVHVLDFPDRFFPVHWGAIKDELAKLTTRKPDLVLSHCPNDLHQDHRVIAELTPTLYRDSVILGYEIVKFDGDLDKPNVFFPITQAQLDSKIDALCKYFPSQAEKHWFDPKLFTSIARIRGVECNSEFAEAFHSRKTVLG